MLQGSGADLQGNFCSRKVRQQFHILLNRPQLTYTTVVTTNTDIRSHEPLYIPEGSVREGLKPQTHTLTLGQDLVKRFEDRGWVVMLSPGKNGKKHMKKQPHLELWCQLAIRHDNKSIEVGIDVIAPECILFRRKLHSINADRTES